jgi:hypothetical protein
VPRAVGMPRSFGPSAIARNDVFPAARSSAITGASPGPDLLRALRTAIGEELKTSFAVPEELPPEMLALLKRMN